ncbi:MAG: thymidylate kinase [Candidatus Doudnabacteria bacterium]|nr:thymidylate kinase [Candidatus Doudnabacteria bacterium]
MAILKKISFGKDKKANTSQQGKFIVIDGTDGSGKATQTNLLVEELKMGGYEVEMTDFPQYGTKSAGLIEEYLNGKYGQVGPEAASIFYAIDRFDASFKIRQWLNEGKIVISNRYVTANAGHQGGKITDDVDRLKYFKWLDNLEYNIFNIPKPDLNIILHMPAETAQQLVDKKSADVRGYANGKKRDLHEADLNHLKNAEKVYLQIAKLFPNTKLVECVRAGELLSPSDVHNQVWELVRRIALKDVKPK